MQAHLPDSGRVANARVVVDAGEREVVRDLEFEAGLTLSGRVVEDERPLASVQVLTAGPDGVSAHAITGIDGGFRLEGLEPGSYDLVVKAGEALLHREPVAIAEDREIRVDVVAARVAGRVRSVGDGEPIAGVRIQAEPAGGELLSEWRRLTYRSSVESDSRGRFVLPRLPPGGWRVTATKEGYAPVERLVEIRAGAVPEALDLLLQPTEGIIFEPVHASGEPPGAVQVAIVDPAGGVLIDALYPSLERGRVRISTVPAGTWELRVQGDGSAVRRVRFEAPGDLGGVVLDAGGRLRVRLPELEDDPEPVLVTLTDAAGRPHAGPHGLGPGQTQWLMTRGHGLFDNLLPGTWTATVRHRDGRTWTVEATVTAGAETEVTVP